MKKLAVAVIAALCALSIAGLAGCGGGAASSSAASSAAGSASASSAAVSDEDQIKAAFDDTMKTILSPEVIGAALQSDESMSQIAEATGLDMNDFAEMILSAISFDAKDVKVDGDAAVLAAVMTVPDFESAEADQLMDQKVDELLADVDIDSATTEDMGKLFADLMKAVLEDPAMPTTEQEFDINFNKVDGKWVMEDAEELSAAVQGSI